MSYQRSDVVDAIEDALRETEFLTPEVMEGYRKAARHLMIMFDEMGVLNVPKPRSELKPQLQQTPCSKPLEALEQELNRLYDAMPKHITGLQRYEHNKKITRVRDAIQLIKELQPMA